MPNNVKLLFFIFLLLCGGASQKALSQSLHGIKGLPPYERAVLIIKHYEGWHGKKDYPYIGYGHQIQPGENLRYPITEAQADSLLRSDLTKLCAMFRKYDADSLLLACIAYNCGPARLLGDGKRTPKSRLLRKLDQGNRDIFAECLTFCRYKGRPIPSIRRRRWVEYHLLFGK